MSLNKDLLLLGKGQNRGEFVSQSRRQGLCAEACNSALVSAAKGGVGPEGGGFGAIVGISLVFGKREFCPKVLRADRGGRWTLPTAMLVQSGLRLGLAQEPEWQRMQPASG